MTFSCIKIFYNDATQITLKHNWKLFHLSNNKLCRLFIDAILVFFTGRDYLILIQLVSLMKWVVLNLSQKFRVDKKAFS